MRVNQPRLFIVLSQGLQQGFTTRKIQSEVLEASPLLPDAINTKVRANLIGALEDCLTCKFAITGNFLREPSRQHSLRIFTHTQTVSLPVEAEPRKSNFFYQSPLSLACREIFRASDKSNISDWPWRSSSVGIVIWSWARRIRSRIWITGREKVFLIPL